MIPSILKWAERVMPAQTVHAHCDGPCGVYDPAQARVAAEAVLSLTKKILSLGDLLASDPEHLHTLIRYTAIKEQQAEETKHHLLVLWTDYFKPEHVKEFPGLHEIFWKAAKLCSTCKQEVSEEHAKELLEAVHTIHEIFWKTKGRPVAWELVNPM